MNEADTSSIRWRCAPGDVARLIVTQTIEPGEEILIDHGNGGRTARLNTFVVPKGKVDFRAEKRLTDNSDTTK